jgi:hypothetical protein
MPRLVACFSGGIASGKTTVTEALAAELGWPRTTFSNYLRHVLAQQGNDDPSRSDLQDLGQSLVRSDPEQFVKNVLQQGGFRVDQNFLLDGIRHIDIYHRVQRLVAPSRFCLIHLGAAEDVLAFRSAGRGDAHADFARAQRHAVERELTTSLPAAADYVVDASLPLDAVVEQSREAIREAAGKGD